MRASPDAVPAWEAVYDEVIDARPEFERDWMLGRAPLNDLIGPLSAALPMSPIEVSRHLLHNLGTVTWFADAKEWIQRLDGRVPQAIVTVNPHEFWGIAYACGLDELVDVIITSAEMATESKVDMVRRARGLLGLDDSLATTLLIDNKAANITEFEAAGGRGHRFSPEAFGSAAPGLLGPLAR